MKNAFYALPWALLGFTAMFFVLAFRGPTEDVSDKGATTELLRQTYAYTEGVYASSLTPQLIEVVQRRVACFGESPLKRLDGGCNVAYLQDIMELGRKDIQSAPQVGDFLINVNLCPIMYSVCMGEKADQSCVEMDGETRCGPAATNDLKCAAMESRCIDSVLDRYWRGAPVDLTGMPSFVNRNSLAPLTAN